MDFKNDACQAMPLLRHCSIREGELGAKSKQQGKQGQCRHQQGPSPAIPKRGKQSSPVMATSFSQESRLPDKSVTMRQV